MSARGAWTRVRSRRFSRPTTAVFSGLRGSILHNDADAEDALQEAYTRAFKSLDHFCGQPKLGTWLALL